MFRSKLKYFVFFQRHRVYNHNSPECAVICVFMGHQTTKFKGYRSFVLLPRTVAIEYLSVLIIVVAGDDIYIPSWWMIIAANGWGAWAHSSLGLRHFSTGQSIGRTSVCLYGRRRLSAQ